MASDRAAPLQRLKASALTQSDRTEELLRRGVKSPQSFNQVLLLFSLCMYKITLTHIERTKAVLVIKTLGRLLIYLLYSLQ